MNSFDKANDKVKCEICRDIKARRNTLIIVTSKGVRHRVCKECYSTYASGKLNDNYQTAKDNVALYNIKGTDAYEIIKRQEDFIKKIKEGKLYEGK